MKSTERSEQAMRLAKSVLKTTRAINRVRLRADDDLAYMAMNFLTKQTQHMLSLVKLVPSRDALLILRTMLEGWMQLIWLFPTFEGEMTEEDVEAHLDTARGRAALWRHSAGVYEWQRIKDAPSCSVPSEVIEDWKQWFDQHGNKYLKRKVAKAGLSAEAALDEDKNPFLKEWSTLKVSEMIRETWSKESAVIVSRIYSEYSKWQHWDAGLLRHETVTTNTALSLRTELEPRELEELWLLACRFMIDVGVVAAGVVGNREVKAQLIALSAKHLALSRSLGRVATDG